MKYCKFCQHELTEDSTVCPSCGKDNGEEILEARAAEETAEEAVSTEEAVTAEETVKAEEAVNAEESVNAEEAVNEEAASAEEKPAEKKKASPAKIAIAVAAIVVLAAILAALIFTAANQGKASSEPVTPADIVETAATEAPTVPADGNPDDATAKGSYTASDEDVIAAADKVIATAGDFQLTNGDLQVYYWMEVQNFLNTYGSYASMFGLNLAQPMDTQVCPMAESGTWQQFFLSSALGTWRNYQAMAAEAKAVNHQMNPELQGFLDTMEADMEENARANGFSSADEMVKFNLGAAVDIDDYIRFMNLYQRGYSYFADTCGAFDPAAEEIEQYFTDNEQKFADGGITRDTYNVDVRHILIGVDPADAENEDAWKEAEQKAGEVLEAFLAGEQTGERFGQLAGEHTTDPGSQATGGLYTNVAQGQMVPEFDAWCFDAARKPGDTGIVKTQFGYHIMFFVDSHPVWQEQAKAALLDEMTAKFIEEITGKYPLEVTYGDILLGDVDMFAQP